MISAMRCFLLRRAQRPSHKGPIYNDVMMHAGATAFRQLWPDKQYGSPDTAGSWRINSPDRAGIQEGRNQQIRPPALASECFARLTALFGVPARMPATTGSGGARAHTGCAGGRAGRLGIRMVSGRERVGASMVMAESMIQAALGLPIGIPTTCSRALVEFASRAKGVCRCAAGIDCHAVATVSVVDDSRDELHRLIWLSLRIE